MDNWLKEILVCPRDHNKLVHIAGDILVCPAGHRYPIIDGIPVMLLIDKTSTQPEIANMTLEAIRRCHIKENETNSGKINLPLSPIDPYVQEVMGATCGIMYKRLIKRLSCYPIPKLPLCRVKEKYFLDIGCNWGRWCIAASMLGYGTIGIDHNLYAIQAAQRVARQLNIRAHYLVADGRYLPFPENFFDVVFSYSVLQHFCRDDVKFCLSEISRILQISGFCLTQMPNKFGIRNLSNQLRRGFKEAKGFEVRYWTPNELKKTFEKYIGRTSFLIDGFFSLNAQATYKDMLFIPHRFVVTCSELLKSIGRRINLMKYCADSLYVKSIKE